MSKLLILSSLIFFIFILYFFISKIKKYNKYAMMISFFLVIIIASIYSYFDKNRNKLDRQLAISFINGAPLICKEDEISQTNFNYERGTKSFISKPTYKKATIIYDIKDCRLKENNQTKR